MSAFTITMIVVGSVLAWGVLAGVWWAVFDKYSNRWDEGAKAAGALFWFVVMWPYIGIKTAQWLVNREWRKVPMAKALKKKGA